MAKRILLVNQVCGHLFIDIANAFAERFDEVVLMAGNAQTYSNTLDKRVKIVPIYPYKKANVRSRFFSWVVAVFQVYCKLLFSYRKYEVLISSNPPLAAILPAFLINKCTLLIYDIYPDGLIATNFVKDNNLIVKCWSLLNRKSYKKVNVIVTLTNGMADILEKYADRKKIHVVPAWASNINLQQKKDNENLFIKKYNLEGKFIVMYAGNLGKEYHLQPLLQVATLLESYRDIYIVIVGEGWNKHLLKSVIEEKNLHNCLLLPFQSNELFADSLISFQVGVVALAGSVNNVAIPSKTYNLLAAQKPILCIGALDTELADFLNFHQVGKAIEASNPEAMKEYILELYHDKVYFEKLCSNCKTILPDYTKENAKKIVQISMA
jgi:hypothetical protein